MVTFPTVQIVQNSLSVDPSGSRHISGPGFIKLLDTSAGGVLDFGAVNITGSGATSDTKLCYARVSDFGDASGIYFMRFYLKSISDFSAGTYRFLERKGIHFVPNVNLNSADNNTPTIVPVSSNLSGTLTPGWVAGSPWISGTVAVDQTSSEYVWLATEIGGDVRPRTYGGAGGGGFRYSILYDFS